MRVHFPLCSPRNHESAPSLARPGSPGWRTLLPRALALSLALGPFLGGCISSYQWVKEGFSPPLAEAKFASCQLDAERLRYFSAESDEDRADRIRHEAHLCMKADGWHLVQTDGEGGIGQEIDEPGKSASRMSSDSAGESGSGQASESSSEQSDGKSNDKSDDKKDDAKDDDSDDDSEE